MKWFKGDINQAVAQAKQTQALFVVYVGGKDDTSAKLLQFIEEPANRAKLESDDVVAIKIESESQAYVQFSKIYQMVPVPSIFFINNAGTPVEIGTGLIKNAEELQQRIDRALLACGKTNADVDTSASTTTTSSEEESATEANRSEKSSATEVVCQSSVCRRKPATEAVAKNWAEPQASTNNEGATPDTPADKLEQQKPQIINNELNALKEKLRRQKAEDEAVRVRIRAQISADRAEHKQKIADDKATAAANAAKASPAEPSAAAETIGLASNMTRLQFRLPNGTSQHHTFNRDDLLSIVREYVHIELLPGTRMQDFTLATVYPKREFDAEHDMQTLLELELFPSAVILVMRKSRSHVSERAALVASSGLVAMLSYVFWTMMVPVLRLFNYFKSFRGTDENTLDAQRRHAAKRRTENPVLNPQKTVERDPNASAGNEGASGSKAKSFRQYASGANIHRLTDNHGDSDDENATWNGNSTQQQ